MFPFIDRRRRDAKSPRHLFLCHIFAFPVFPDNLSHLHTSASLTALLFSMDLSYQICMRFTSEQI